jgi:uncharacterized membrane protein
MIAPRRYRYGLLLGLIAVSLSFQLAAPVADWSRLVTVALQGATLVLALRTSQARPLLVRVAAVAVAAALVGSVTAVLSGGDAGSDSTVLTSALLVGLAPAGIAAGVARNIREDQGVSIATMFGVLCIYLLLGMFFAFVYGTISTLGSAEFFAQQSNPTQADFLYFSYTTLTTTGFGDLTAATGLGRAVTISEALVGQVYLVTVVAAIVSNLRPRHA